MSMYSETTTSSSYNTLTAFFESRSDADSAVERLQAAGIAHDSIRVVAGNDTSSGHVETDHKGFWASLGDLFMPDDDRNTYAEGLRRGGYLVSVSNLTTEQHDVALDILDDEGSIDLDEREASWRAEGWSGHQTVADDLVDKTSERTYADAGALGGGVGLTGSSTSTGDEDVIPVYQEQIKVGKRDVNVGRVRVRSYVVETPVSEDVSLRNENVFLERRPVDRAVSGTDAAFTDRTIEAEERREEAVVSKDVRVTEEIALRKESEQRTETVSDTVRHTEVEVEDERTGIKSGTNNVTDLPRR